MQLLEYKNTLGDAIRSRRIKLDSDETVFGSRTVTSVRGDYTCESINPDEGEPGTHFWFNDELIRADLPLFDEHQAGIEQAWPELFDRGTRSNERK